MSTGTPGRTSGAPWRSSCCSTGSRSPSGTTTRACRGPRSPFGDPADAPADGLATSGRGLALVGAVSESWGVRPCEDDGKVVWFTLAAPPAGGPVETREEVVYGAATEGPFTGYERVPAVPLGIPAEPVLSPAPRWPPPARSWRARRA